MPWMVWSCCRIKSHHRLCASKIHYIAEVQMHQQRLASTFKSGKQLCFSWTFVSDHHCLFCMPNSGTTLADYPRYCSWSQRLMQTKLVHLHSRVKQAAWGTDLRKTVSGCNLQCKSCGTWWCTSKCIFWKSVVLLERYQPHSCWGMLHHKCRCCWMWQE